MPSAAKHSSSVLASGEKKNVHAVGAPAPVAFTAHAWRTQDKTAANDVLAMALPVDTARQPSPEYPLARRLFQSNTEAIDLVS